MITTVLLAAGADAFAADACPGGYLEFQFRLGRTSAKSLPVFAWPICKILPSVHSTGQLFLRKFGSRHQDLRWCTADRSVERRGNCFQHPAQRNDILRKYVQVMSARIATRSSSPSPTCFLISDTNKCWWRSRLAMGSRWTPPKEWRGCWSPATKRVDGSYRM